jgi:hypothetical protein
MSTPVVTVVRGGIPVTDSAYGLPVTEAAAGLAVTTVASGGLPIAGRAAPFFNNAGAANFTKVLAGLHGDEGRHPQHEHRDHGQLDRSRRR